MSDPSEKPNLDASAESEDAECCVGGSSDGGAECSVGSGVPTDEALTTKNVENVGADPGAKRDFKRVAAFFSSNWLYFAAPVLIFGLFFGVLFAFEVYPFSTKSMSSYDLLAQICPFIEHFFDVIDGKSSLLYSNAIMGGADVFGTLAYCCISPFTFLFLLFGRGNAYYAVSFVLPLKLSCVALSAIFFIRKTFKNVPDYVALVLSLLFAYCGYTFVANTYINWVDFLIYMPFVVMGFIKLVKEKKMRYFAIAYALMIYTCFSIASFALLLVYLVFILYVLICVDKAERRETLFKCCMALVLAVAIALPLMVPSFVAYTKSGRNTGLFENLDKALDSKHLDAKLSYIISDTCCLFFTLIYFVERGLKKRENVFLLLVGVLIMMPVLVDEVCNLLNAGSYMSYALRFGFLNATYALYLTAKLFNGVVDHKVRKKAKLSAAPAETLSDQPKTADLKDANAVGAGEATAVETLRKKPKKAPLVSPIANVITICVFAAAAIVAAYLFIHFSVGKINGEDDFSGRFAHSLGGIVFIGQLSLIVAVMLLLGYVLFKLRLTTFKALSFIMIGVFAVQIAFYNIYLVKGNILGKIIVPARYDQFNAISDTIKENYETTEDGYYYYRIKDYDDALTNAAPFITHTNCFSVFSSVIDSANIVPTKFFEYGGNGVNNIKSKGGLFFGDALLGYKYYFIHNDSYKEPYTTHASEKRSYNVLLEDTQQSYFQGVLNTICFPNANVVYGDGDCVFDGDYYENMTKLYNFLGGEGELFDDYEIRPSAVFYDEETGVYTIRVYIVDEGQWYMAHDFSGEFDLSYTTGTYKEDKKKDLSGAVINFNYNKKATSSYFNCRIKNYSDKELTKADVIAACKGRCLPLSKISELNELLQSRAANYRVVGGDEYRVKATSENENGYLFMNYVAIDGFKVTVNGKKAEFIDNGLNFMLVKLDEGENEVVISYTSPYYLFAFLGLVAGAALVALVWFLTKKLKKEGKAYGVITKIVSVAAYVLAAGVFGFFIAFPFGVFLKKLFVLIFL